MMFACMCVQYTESDICDREGNMGTVFQEGGVSVWHHDSCTPISARLLNIDAIPNELAPAIIFKL